MTSLSADAVALRLLDRFSASDTASVTAPTSDNATMSTPMPVALGDKPTRRSRTVTTPTETQIPTPRRSDQSAAQSAKTHVHAACNDHRTGTNICIDTTRSGA